MRPGNRAVSLVLPGLISILGLAAGGLGAPGRADPPRGGEVVLFDRGSGLGGTSAALLAVDVDAGLIRPISFASDLVTPHGVTWGPGKTIYIGDAQRLWAVDSYRDPSSGAREIRHRYLFAVVDLVHAPDGRIFVLDQFADPLEEGYSGAVFQLDPATDDVALIASDSRFVAPSSIVAEASGTLLVLDPYGRTAPGGAPVGAVYRVDPRTHEVRALFSLQFLAPGTRPLAIALKDPNTLLLVDADATLPNRPPLSGAVYVVSLVSYEAIGVISDSQFRDPVDIVVTANRRLVVVDASANLLGDPVARGALFVFDLTTNELLSTMARRYFRVLDSAAFFEGPDLDGSRLRLTDRSGGGLHPGDVVRFEAALVNTGPTAPGTVRLTAETDAWVCLFGSGTAETGTLSFDDAASRLHWEGQIGLSDSVHLQVDLRVPDSATSGSVLSLSVRLESGVIRLDRVLADTVGTSVTPGLTVYVDAGAVFPAPRLFTLARDGWTPEELFYDDVLLTAPADATFGLDGTLYILNTSPARILALDVETADATVLYEGVPLMRPSGICLAHDGALLIADPSISSPINLPGTVYRFDPITRELTTFYTEDNPDLLRDPVDICPDRGGHYLVTDYQSKAGGGEYGALFEIDQTGHRVGQPYTAGAIMSDPFSSVVAPDGSVLITDIDLAHGTGSVIRLRRPIDEPVRYERIAGPDDSMLVQPLGIEWLERNKYLICDAKNSPNAPNLGAVTRLEFAPEGGWRLIHETYHTDIRQPRRAAIFRAPEPECAGLELEDRNGGRLMPGDTLEARAALTNRATTPGLGVGAVLSYPSVLHPVSESTTDGQTLLNDAFGTVHWSGDLAFLETDTLTVRFRVDSLALQGELVELAVEMLGAAAPGKVTARDTVSAPLRGGEWIVLDQQSDAFGSRLHGGLFTLNAEASTLTPFMSHPALVKPADVYPDGTGRMLIVDSEADPRDFGDTTGAVFTLDTQTNRMRVFSASRRYERPQRILPDPGGGWLVLDASAAECAAPASGAIFHVPSEGGEPELFCCDPQFRRLLDMAFDGQGHLWVSDPYANPLGHPTNIGAVFSIDLERRVVVQTVSLEEMHDPTGLLWVPGRGLLFTDPAYRDGFGNSVIRSLNPVSGQIGVVFGSPYLRTPTRMVADGNRIWIADSTAVPPGSELRGAIVEADLPSQQIIRFIQSPVTRRLQALGRVPWSQPSITEFAAREDGAGRWHASGDTIHCEIAVENHSATGEPWATLDVRLSLNATLDPGSISASQGQIAAADAGLFWQGELAGHDRITMGYAAVLTRHTGVTPFVVQRATLSVPFGAGDSARLSHYISNQMGDRELVVADAAANPLGLPDASGALLRIEGPAREAVPIIADSSFVSPVAVQLLPESQTELLIVDADARVSGSGGGGCLFRASTITGEVQRVFTDPSFVEPVAVVVADAHVAYLLDQRADPFNLRPGGGDDGPGAIYRIDLDSNAGEVLASDTLFVNPVDLLWEPSSGDLFVIDRSATSGGGGFAGGVFRVDPTSGVVTPFWIGGPFRSPRCGVIGSGGKILVADHREIAGTVVYSVDGLQVPSIFGSCEEAETPRNLLFEPEGTLLMADATGNPEGLEEPTGSVRRIGRTGDPCRIYITGAPLTRPSGLAIFYAPVPVDHLDARVTQTAEGIEIAWTVPAEDGEAEYYLYRRETGETEGPYEALNPERPVRGPGPVAYLDPGVGAAGHYQYLIVAVFSDGTRREYGPFDVDVEQAAPRFFLAAPSPNPLALRSGATGLLVRFGVPRRGTDVRLALIDVTGRRVRDLWRGRATEAVQSVAWDGRDASGDPLGSGIYFLRLEAGSRVANRRVILIR